MKLLTTFILLTISIVTWGQSSQTKGEKRQRTLTYFCFGDGGCGPFIDTEKLYGFKMKWKRCIVKDRHIRHNRRVERKINERLGDNWLAENIRKLEIGYGPEN